MEKDQLALVEEALLDTKVDEMKSKFSADMDTSMVTHAGPIGQEATDISSIEYMPLYNTKDGRKVDVLPTMLKAKLTLRWRSEHDVPEELIGEKVWSISPVEVARGQELLCPLHPKAEGRAMADTMGVVTVCRRDNLPNALVRRLHMEKRHPVEQRVMDEQRDDMRRAEDRESQQATLAAMQALAGNGPVKEKK